METIKQLSLFSEIEDINSKNSKNEIENWGTFKDSLKAPVHRWFTYPAGFSYKAVIHSIERFGITSDMVVYDPFMGSGTTNLTCKSLAISSLGVEAHPFVYKIAKAKMNWEINYQEAVIFIKKVENIFIKKLDETINQQEFSIENCFPELVIKCYSKNTIEKLYILKNILEAEGLSEPVFDFFYVVITALLRDVSSAATGWPYIAPKKLKPTSADKEVLVEFIKLSYQMLKDIKNIKQGSSENHQKSTHNLFNADSRNTEMFIKNQSVDYVFTSPPYLNNFDYSDRTRLELYFWGDAKNWKEISDNFRTKLITSATTQILRGDSRYILLDDFRKECDEITNFIQTSAHKLAELRKIKGGKKSYDLMVIGYFNDMYKILKDVYRVLKPNTKALFVLGDSAPYGIYIPTDKLIGEIGVCIGFDNYKMEVLRKRGDKWKDNPQRHNISLQESIIILEKK
jgi:DNA modification methylase